MNKIGAIFFIIFSIFTFPYSSLSQEYGKYKFDTRITIDASSFYVSESNTLTYNDKKWNNHSIITISNARIGFFTNIDKHWDVKIQVGISNGGVSFKDTYISYMFNNKSLLTIGNQKDPTGLYQETSSKFLSYPIPTPIAYIVPSRRIGVKWQYPMNNHYVCISTSFSDINNNIHNFENRLRPSITARYTNHFKYKNNLFHIGFYGNIKYSNSGENIHMNAYTGSGLHSLSINELTLNKVRLQCINGIEILAITPKIQIQGEFISKYISLGENTYNKNFFLYGGYLKTVYSLKNQIVKYNYTNTSIEYNNNSALDIFTEIGALNNTVYSSVSIVDIKSGITWYPNRHILASLYYNVGIYNNQNNRKYLWHGNNLYLHAINIRLQTFF